ncbi:type I-E CRISPR-associated protein Cse2/CasB [Streptomyces aidingensis]|uniref:CRISPR system Cascade subunit CasB n=1 Tax=Streptomyces aidingensis TaxID=910347 RepID=A0A1I1H578_9ACTN|nr:type I-E CRISPR-associated protein Cse2/CasB [Streptomyces aidingensis]SFC18885.1 CRISPR system Cascade subunit CasB [Streptomyces aidingensis]
MTTAVQAPSTVRSRVAQLVAERITPWQVGYLGDRPHAVAALARLRRGAGRDAAELPDLWGLVDTGPLHSDAEGLRPLSEQELVRAENALYAAVTLWAFHQQSRGAPMHRPHGRERPAGLGAAVRRLMPPNGIDEPVRKRLVRAGTAPDLVTATQRLRDLVALLRRADIPLDYGLLAGQLYAWQWPDGPAAVRREWGRSFHTWQHPGPADGDTAAPLPTTDTDKDDKDAS